MKSCDVSGPAKKWRSSIGKSVMLVIERLLASGSISNLGITLLCPWERHFALIS